MASDPFITSANPLVAPWATASGWANLRCYGPLAGNASGSDSDSAMRYSTSSSQRSIITYASGTTDGGAAFLDPSGNGYLFTAFDVVNVHIFIVTGGPSYSQLGGDITTTAWTAGDQLQLMIDGNDLVYLRNAVEIARRTDTTFRTGLNPAIFAFAGDFRVSAWSDGVTDLLTGPQLWMLPGPGISPNKLFMFARRTMAQTTMLNDTSLTAVLSSSSAVSANLTAIGSTGAVRTAGPGISPDYMRLFRPRLFTASQPFVDTSLAATLVSQSSVTAGLTTAIRMQAAVASQSTVTAALTTAIRLQAALQAVSTLTATLDGTPAVLAATLQSVSTLTAALTTAIPLAATLGCQSAVTAALSTAIRFAGTLASQSTVVATLTNGPTGPLAAALASQSTVIAALTTAIRMQASLGSVSTLTATLTGGAAELTAVLQSVSTLLAELTDTVRVQPFGPAIWDVREGQFASRRNPYVSMLAPHDARLVVGPDPVVIARFAWADDDGLVRTIRTGEQRLGWVRQVFGPRRAIYADRGLRWIRPGLPITLYVRGEFWARFAGGAQAGDVVYVSLIDGGPLSGYAADALPTQWRVATSAFPEELAIITTWE